MSRFKKHFITVCCVFAFVSLCAQTSVGFSAAMSGYIPVYRQSYKVMHLGKYTTPIPAFRLEANLVMSSFSGIGVSFSLPVRDSVFVAGRRNYQLSGWRCESVTRYFNFCFRFGYEIPQEYSDFLLIHAGFGFGFERQKIIYQITDFDPSTDRFEDEDIDTESMKKRNGEMTPELFVGALYEFEKFSLFAQYGFRFSFGDESLTYKYNSVITAGVYCPVKRLFENR